jgi:hypothetical protein
VGFADFAAAIHEGFHHRDDAGCGIEGEGLAFLEVAGLDRSTVGMAEDDRSASGELDGADGWTRTPSRRFTSLVALPLELRQPKT